jgi:hypothetical protein
VHARASRARAAKQQSQTPANPLQNLDFEVDRVARAALTPIPWSCRCKGLSQLVAPTSFSWRASSSALASISLDTALLIALVFAAIWSAMLAA